MPDTPPLVSVLPEVVAINGLIDFRDMFTVTDPDPGAQVQLYRFRDNGVLGGRFQINGASQATNTWVEITALQLSSVKYRGDNVKSQETYSVQVYDGLFWSNVATSTITTGNSTPVFTATDGRVAPFEKIKISTRFSFTDADNDPILRYQFIDRNSNVDGGHFLLRGQRLPSGQTFLLEAGDLSALEYRGGQFGRQTELIGVQGFDGFSWSEEVQFEMATTDKTIITAPPVQVVALEKRLARTLFSFVDPDGDAPFAFSFVDRRLNADGGYFEFQGQRKPSATWFSVLASQMGQLYYVGGLTGPQSENVSIQIFDGFEFSDIKDVVVDTIPRPVVTGVDASIKANHFLNVQTGNKANTIGVTNPGGTPILSFSSTVTSFRFFDQFANSNGGHFVFKGAVVPSSQWFTVLKSELSELEYRGGSFGPQQEEISVQGFGSGVWSSVSKFTLSTLQNVFRPDLTMFNVQARLGTVLQLEGLFAAQDLDGDLLTSFGIFDTGSDPSSGFFTVNGVVQPAQTWIYLNYNQVGSVQYHVPTLAGNERIRMTVSDGTLVSVIKAANIQAIPTPVISVLDNDISVDTLEGRSAGSLIQQIDAGPAFTRYEVFDENFASNPDRSGRLFLRQPGPGNLGEELQGGVVHSLTAAQFARLELQGSEADFGRVLDGILVRATNDVTGWSEWERININTDPIGSDALTSGTQWVDAIPNVTVVPFTFIDGNRVNGPYPPLPTYYVCPPSPNPDQECNNPNALNAQQREMIREVLAYYETVANIDFVEVPWTADAGTAALTFGAADLPTGVGAWAYLPNGNPSNGFASKPGDVWFNNLAGFDPSTNPNVGMGSAMRFTAYHEIGHAVGFKHPFELSPVLSVFNDFDYNTVMSYQSDNNNNPFDAYPESPSTLMLYDIVELQRLYGTNTNYRTGNDHYFYQPVLASAAPAERADQTTLWDAGGSDTINMANHTIAEVIDLREGSWSSVNGVPQSLRIAYGTRIENARGGSGNDRLTGNETDNLLFGNAGSDTLRGGGGNDILRGGEGGDTYVWSLGDGRDTVFEQANPVLNPPVLVPVDALEFFDPSGTISSLQDDFVFRRFGNDMRIDFAPNLGAGQGTVLISNFANVDLRIEKLRIHGLGGNQIGGDIDLSSSFASLDSSAKRFRVSNVMGANGFLMTQV